MEPVNPSLGGVPDKTGFTLLPTYKSGFLLKLGTGATMIAVGRLVNKKNEPIAHCPIIIYSLDDPDKKAISSYTNSRGKYQIPNARPGLYEIRPINSDKWEKMIIEIPDETADVYRIGALMPGFIENEPGQNVTALHKK